MANSDSIDSLVAIYTVERTDVQNVLGHALVLLSIMVAYAAVVGGAWSTNADAIPPWLTVFIPVPLLGAIAWHSQLISIVFAHNQSIKQIENALLSQISTIPNSRKIWVGANSGRLVTDTLILVKQRRIGMAAASIISYACVAGVTLGLTTASILVPLTVAHSWQWLAWTMAGVYLILVGLLVLSYIEAFQIDEINLDNWAGDADARHLL